MNIDLFLLDWIQLHLTSPIMNQVMVLITHLGDGAILWFLLAAFFLFFPKTRKNGLTLLLSLLIEILLCNVLLKPLVARPRPFELHPEMTLLIARPMGFSFPSGHTGAAFAAVSALQNRQSKFFPAVLILACLIAFSRLYLYVHYPSDVLASVAIGLLTGRIAQILIDRYPKYVTE